MRQFPRRQNFFVTSSVMKSSVLSRNVTVTPSNGESVNEVTLTGYQKSSSASAYNFICSKKEPLSLAANASAQFWSNVFKILFFFRKKMVNFKVYWYLNFELILAIMKFSTSDNATLAFWLAHYILVTSHFTCVSPYIEMNAANVDRQTKLSKTWMKHADSVSCPRKKYKKLWTRPSQKQQRKSD